MGADLIGFLVKGPEKIELTEDLRSAAMKQLGKITEYISRYEQTQNNSSMSTAVNEALQSDLDHAYEQLGNMAEDQDMLYEELTSLELGFDDEALGKFVEWWHSPLGRNIAYRSDPDDDTKRIFFAGDMSWGDEPDGIGYRYLKWAVYTGVGALLGIY